MRTLMTLFHIEKTFVVENKNKCLISYTEMKH